MNRRLLLTLAAMSVVVVLGGAYLVEAGGRQSSGDVGTAGASGDLMFVELADGANRVEVADPSNPGAAARPTGLSCLRVYVAAGVTACLTISGPGPTYSATITGPGGAAIRTVKLPGIPSRTRVSASGRIVSWTSFVSGDSYSIPGGFSTRTGFLDIQTGDLEESIEHFGVEVDGVPFTAIDINFWGMTVASDDHTFYITMGSGDRTWLMKGDLRTKKLASVRLRAECPSLSPDGSRVAYKKRTSRFGPWELAVLDLSTGVERVLPGTAGIDDQAEWIDGANLAYAGLPVGGRVADVHIVPADGSRPAEDVIPGATSPVGVR